MKFRVLDRVKIVKGEAKGVVDVIERLDREKSLAYMSQTYRRINSKGKRVARAVPLCNLRQVDHELKITKVYYRKSGLRANSFRYYLSNGRMVRGDLLARLINRRRLLSKWRT